MSQEGIQPFISLMNIHQGLYHPTITSCDDKQWHPNTYRHYIIFKYVCQKLKHNVLNFDLSYIFKYNVFNDA